jgi:hypothetical protein
MEFLSRFDCEFKHIAGRTNVADPISRVSAAMARTRSRAAREVACPSSDGGEAPPIAPALELTVLEQQIIAGYAVDPVLSKTELVTWYQRSSRRFWTKDGKIVVPPTVREAVMHDAHDTPTAGHQGVARTLEKCERDFYWPTMKADVEAHVRACDSCQRIRSSNQKPGGLLQPLRIPERPWQSVSMDFITKLPRTKRGHDAILVVVDRLTKMTHFVPCRTDIDAVETARLFIDNIFKLHGLPEDIISDRESRFLNNFWSYMCGKLEVKQRPSSAYHPQTDGQTERMNRVLEDTLRHFVGPRQDDWDDHLACAEFAINNSKTPSTGSTPFLLNYGRHPSNPEIREGPTRVRVPDAETFTRAIQDGVREARACLEAAQSRMKAQEDKRRRDVSFQVGQKVLLNTTNYRWKHGSAKLLPRWIGPYAITRLVGPAAAELELPPNLEIHNVFHVSLLKPYVGDAPVQPPPVEWIEGELPSFEVERILAHREPKTKRGKREYLILWKGYGPEHSTWEEERNLDGCDEELNHYWTEVLHRPRPVTSRPRRAAALIRPARVSILWTPTRWQMVCEMDTHTPRRRGRRLLRRGAM